MTRARLLLCAALVSGALWVPAWAPMRGVVGVTRLAAQQDAADTGGGHASAKGSAAAAAAASSDSGDADNSDADDNSDNDNSDNDSADRADASTARGGHSVRFARQLHPGEESAPMHVEVMYGKGTLSVAPADGAWLYDVRTGYASRGGEALVRFDPRTRTLRVGASRTDDHKLSVSFDHDADGSDLRIALGRGVPLDLMLAFGAGNVRAQLGGLSIERLDVETAASDAEIHFAEPNPVTLDELQIKAGAAGFRATGLGNAHARRIVVQAGLGDVDLDFGGQWTGNVVLDATAALGAVHIHVPQNVVIDQNAKVFIGAFNDNTGTRHAAAGGSPGGQVYHLQVTGTATLGGIDLDHEVH